MIIKYKNFTPTIDETVFLAPTSQIIGDVEIGEFSSIWFNCVIRGDVCPIRIGKHTNIQDGTIIHVSRKIGPTTIGNYVTIGHKALVHAATICDYAFIGMGSIMLDHSIVESHGFLAAGALLTPNKIVKSGELWAGSPAKFLRKLTQQEIDHISDSAQNYVNLSSEYRNNGL